MPGTARSTSLKYVSKGIPIAPQLVGGTGGGADGRGSQPAPDILQKCSADPLVALGHMGRIGKAAELRDSGEGIGGVPQEGIHPGDPQLQQII